MVSRYINFGTIRLRSSTQPEESTELAYRWFELDSVLPCRGFR
jgi:hypothetical protein